METNIISMNVRGIGNSLKRKSIFEWFKSNNFDIILMQEVHFTNNSIEKWREDWGGECVFSGNSTRKEGVAILINAKSNIQINKYTEITEGRMLSLDITLEEKAITIINIYGPNKDDPSLFDTLENTLLANDDKSYIIGGDFNTILNGNLDKKNGKIDTHKKCREKLNLLMNSCNVSDVWRIQHPNRKQYTWHSTQKPFVHCRLDYFLISDNLLNTIKSSNIKPGYKTDHSIISINYDNLKADKGPGYYKLNNSILLDKEYQNNIKQCITDTVYLNKNTNPNTLWEIIKGAIRNESIKYSSFKKKTIIKDEKEIRNRIKELETQLDGDNNDEEITKQLIEQKQRLNEILDTKIKGSMLRANAIHIESNEKNSNYFANLERKQAERKTINKLNIDGKLVTGIKPILQEEVNYYKKLYTKDETLQPEIKHIFLNDTLKTLNEDEKKTCEGLITIYECENALREMNNNKSPGSDGLTVEFYKIFWNDIK